MKTDRRFMKIAIVRECIAALFLSFRDKARERTADDPDRARLRGATRESLDPRGAAPKGAMQAIQVAMAEAIA
jgi:hypothetical protein